MALGAYGTAMYIWEKRGEKCGCCKAPCSLLMNNSLAWCCRPSAEDKLQIIRDASASCMTHLRPSVLEQSSLDLQPYHVEASVLPPVREAVSVSSSVADPLHSNSIPPRGDNLPSTTSTTYHTDAWVTQRGPKAGAPLAEARHQPDDDAVVLITDESVSNHGVDMTSSGSAARYFPWPNSPNQSEAVHSQVYSESTTPELRSQTHQLASVESLTHHQNSSTTAPNDSEPKPKSLRFPTSLSVEPPAEFSGNMAATSPAHPVPSPTSKPTSAKTKSPSRFRQSLKVASQLYRQALMELAGIRDQDLIYDSLKVQCCTHAPYYIALDHKNKSIVIVVRGTLRCVLETEMDPALRRMRFQPVSGPCLEYAFKTE